VSTWPRPDDLFEEPSAGQSFAPSPASPGARQTAAADEERFAAPLAMLDRLADDGRTKEVDGEESLLLAF